LVLEHSYRLTSQKRTASEWAAAENAKRHPCQCGCGNVIKVIPQHRARGIPGYLKAHHPMAMAKDVRELRADGLLTVTQVAKELGIGPTTLRRLEGTAYPKVPRRGYRDIRAYTSDEVDAIRRWLKEHTALGSEPGLVPLEEVARRAGCSPHTIRSHLGRGLPSGRRQLSGSRVRIMFTPAEADRIVETLDARKGPSGRLRRGVRALPWPTR
jgi:DNA-binding transcriptional MerR regulator